MRISGAGGTDKICDTTGEQTTKISIYSDYGNIPSLGLLDGSYYKNDGVYINKGLGNFTFINNAGNGTVYPCSNQGICNHKYGTCLCEILVQGSLMRYQAVSSDGKGGPGSRGIYYTLYTLYTLYTRYTRYTLYTLVYYTLYTLYSLSPLYTLYTLYTLSPLYTLYTRYTLHS